MSLSQPLTDEFNTFGWNWDNSYARLPDILFQRVTPTRFPQPQLIIFNRQLAYDIGLNPYALSDMNAALLFAGQIIPIGAEPIAQAYAGHQYGGFTMLGDGRAILLGEQVTPTGQRFDIQFKGSGQTIYSRRGDGLAVLGPMLREYLISEAMQALGIPTTRSLAVVATGQSVLRECLLPGAILTRVAASHIRVGTFQFLAAQRKTGELKQLADYTIDRHYPELKQASNPYLELLREVALRQARLIAQWQLIGFVHGVMNTDNMAISGETIDYGPCAFMEAYHPATVFSSIDDGGRYAYGNQPRIAHWNLARFAETLLPLIHEDQQTAVEQALEVLNQFPDQYQQAWSEGMRRKLGLRTVEDDDAKLIEELLNWMEQTATDFTNTFRDLSSESACDRLCQRYENDAAFQAWYHRWRQRLQRENEPLEQIQSKMRAVNPYVIPRNHQVEAVLAAAQDGHNLTPLHELLSILQQPFVEQEIAERYRCPAPSSFCGYRTFCGT
jgi:uncharacterized protein YdiU (UPF0061 family)